MKYFKAARVFDAIGSDLIADGGVLVDGASIMRVGRPQDLDLPAEVEVIDLGDVTLMPGLIDLHTHLMSWTGDQRMTFDPSCGFSFEAASNLRHALEKGVTTIRDVGTYGDVGVAAKWAVERGLIPGPRVFACRNIICMTGGHGSEGEPGMAREADGPEDVRKAVREQIKAGADLIKVTTNGPLNFPEFTQAELDALVDEAHNAGRRVACHASLRESTRRAIQAGVDTIEHGCELDAELIDQMLEKDIILVPTLLVLERFMARWDHFKSNPIFRALPQRYRGQIESFKLALDAGIKIGTGVDPTPGIAGFAEVDAEAATIVQYGCEPVRALKAATSMAAEALGKADEFGSLAPGQVADMVTVAGNPVEDIAALSNVRMVIQEGKVVHDGTVV